MKVELKPGKYVIAVSGGVDSVALLDMLSKLPAVELVVAHFDHGIRENSAEDRVFVEELAEQYGLPFEYSEGSLGPEASEATARSARYKFLAEIKEKHRADAIITAHHEDDMLETAIINLLRGTRRKGLSSLGSGKDLHRPLLGFPKSDIVTYARLHNLKWHEDSTNQEEIYLRNYVRRQLLPHFSSRDKQKLSSLINRSAALNKQLDKLLTEELRQHSCDGQLDRRWFTSLPYDAAMEVMAAWLRGRDIRGFDQKALERLVVAAKTGRQGQRFDVMKGVTMEMEKNDLALVTAER